VLRDHNASTRHLGWIDFHTGLGPSGHGERIFACRDDAAALVRARQWWGSEVTSIYDGSSTSAPLTGLMWLAAYVPVADVLDALRADQWLENHPETPAAQREAIKRGTRDAFYTDTDAWKLAIVAQARDAAGQAVAGLAIP
jgi:hypothetical protein